MSFDTFKSRQLGYYYVTSDALFITTTRNKNQVEVNEFMSLTIDLPKYYSSVMLIWFDSVQTDLIAENE